MDTFELAVCPSCTAPKVTALGDTWSEPLVAGDAPLNVPPTQPSRTSAKQHNKKSKPARQGIFRLTPARDSPEQPMSREKQRSGGLGFLKLLPSDSQIIMYCSCINLKTLTHLDTCEPAVLRGVGLSCYFCLTLLRVSQSTGTVMHITARPFPFRPSHSKMIPCDFAEFVTNRGSAHNSQWPKRT